MTLSYQNGWLAQSTQCYRLTFFSSSQYVGSVRQSCGDTSLKTELPLEFSSALKVNPKTQSQAMPGLKRTVNQSSKALGLNM